jgi:hypothetical protein
MDVAVGAAHWVRERALRKTNAGMPYCLCSLYCKTDRGYESAINEIPLSPKICKERTYHGRVPGGKGLLCE